MSRDQWPPGDGSGPVPRGKPDHAVSAAAKLPNTASGNDGGDTAAAFRRRRDAARRLPPLDCGCFDPWLCRCSRPPLNDRMIDGGRAAAEHLLDIGLVPMLELDTLRALYRRGGDDRQL